MAWQLTLLCDGCDGRLEMDPGDCRVGDPDNCRGRAGQIAREAIDYKGWRREERGRRMRFYCPTCRLARERRSLVPEGAAEGRPGGGVGATTAPGTP
jgi:hypothetical protein